MESKSGITWINAEKDCQVHNAHLASIMSLSEMYLIHSILTEKEVYTSRVYIGMLQSYHNCMVCMSLG